MLAKVLHLPFGLSCPLILSTRLLQQCLKMLFELTS